MTIADEIAPETVSAANCSETGTNKPRKFARKSASGIDTNRSNINNLTTG